MSSFNIFTFLMFRKLNKPQLTGADAGFCVRGTKVDEGSGDRLRSPAGPGQNPGRGPGGKAPSRKLLVLSI